MDRWRKLRQTTWDEPPDELPIILAKDGPHGPVIHDTTRPARLLGAEVGKRVVDIRAAAPDIIVEYADDPGDRAFLDRLAGWAKRWSPWVSVDPMAAAGAGALVIDTTGSDHLFGGEDAMLKEMEEKLSLSGLETQLAIAPTWGAAWALARYGGVRSQCHDIADLDPLPVASLRLPSDANQTLRRVGIKTVGQLRTIPRSSLMRRFAKVEAAQNPLIRLDQALGQLPEPVAPMDDPVPLRALMRLAEPMQDPVPLIPGLTETLSAQLDRRGEGCRRMRITVFRTDGERRWVEAALAKPTRDAAHMARLFDGKLDRIDPGFGFDAVLLEAADPERLDAAQPDLTGKVNTEEALGHLIDRLTARLGPNHVTRPVLHDSHIPERAQAWVPAVKDAGTAVLDRPTRPLTLFQTPEEVHVIYAIPEGPPVRLKWRGRPLDVVRYEGPERIAPEWWNDRPGTRLRDYYRVEDTSGRRFWVYREGTVGDGRGGAPRWFVHGVFG